MKAAALLATTVYQQYVSPIKGFSCVYRVHTGCRSCSALGYRAIRRYGVWAGLGVLRGRLERCGIAYRRYSQIRATLPGRRQRGFCDFPCDLPIDSCDVDMCSGAGDLFSNCGSCDVGDCGDWSRKRKFRDEEKYVHIPVRGNVD